MDKLTGADLTDELLNRLYHTEGYEDLCDAYERCLSEYRLEYMGQDVEYSHVEYMALLYWSADLFDHDFNRLMDLFEGLDFEVDRITKNEG